MPRVVATRAQGALDRRGVVWGLVAVALTLAISFVGSDGLVWFDAALIGYLFGLVFMVFGVVYRYSVWIRRPPTAMLNRRGWDAFRRHKGRNLVALPSLALTHLVAQGFIRRRSRTRWAAHQLVFWGCLLAAAVTFPLTLPLRYHPSYWALVFPLGMYGAATYRMCAAIDLTALGWLPPLTLAVALVAWVATAAGLVATWVPRLMARARVAG